MPTVAEVKAELKSNGIKGYSGKKKAELYEMIKMLPIASSRRLLGPRTSAAPAVIADSMRKYEEAKERAKAAFEKLSEKKKVKEVVKERTPHEVHISQKSKKAETLAAIKSQIVDEYKKLSKKEQDTLVKRLPGYSNEYEEGHLDKGLEDYLNNHIYSGSYYPYRAVQKLIAKYINERSDDVVTYSPKFRVSRKVQDEIMRMLLGKHHVTMEEIDPSYYTKPRTKEENVLLE